MQCQNITDIGLRNLKPVPKLEELRLDYLNITDAGLASLNKFPALRILYLSHTPKINGSGLANLRLSGLGGLTLQGSAVTDDGLIAGLKGKNCLSLTHLVLTETKLLMLGWGKSACPASRHFVSVAKYRRRYCEVSQTPP